MGGLWGLFTFHLRDCFGVERFQPLKSRLAAIECWVNVPLGNRHARVFRQPHDCKRISPGLSKPGKERMTETMQDKFLWECLVPLPVHDRLSDAAMRMIQAGNEDRRRGGLSWEDIRGQRLFPTFVQDGRGAGG